MCNVRSPFSLVLKTHLQETAIYIGAVVFFVVVFFCLSLQMFKKMVDL